MPQTGLNIFRPALNNDVNEQMHDLAISQATASQKPQRHSSGVTFGGVGESSRYELPGINSLTTAATRPISLQSSFSTNDLPTVKNASGVATNITPSKAYGDQQFYNHNANLGRVPPSTTSNRQSRDFPPAPSSVESKREEKVQNMSSQLQASAAPFGLHMTSTAGSNAMSTSVVPYGPNTVGAYGYSMQSYNLSSTPTNNQQQAVLNGYDGYTTYGGYGRLQDANTRVVHQRRPQGGNEAARYDNVPIENYRGKLYELCKDQHGCRYLQKKLEEKNAEHTRLIFNETCPFVIELMTGKHAKPVSWHC